ncbi:unnamed protein product [Cuscuta europaea]|uniref:Uncharacterized protein n=1 Tax=Cuscuta europaea TaxID=41803 RepID=A0A9P0ZH29_CUSEU|nr:unnamed protein product [Cuscuta europaea]
MKKQIVEVLDNVVDQMRLDEKYGEMSYTLRDMFVDYFTEVGLDNDSNTFYKPNLKRLTMNWREANNVHDYGLWSMRHMETYMGKGVKGWDCGVKKGDAKELSALRVRYCAVLITSDVNEMKDKNLDEVKSFAKGKNIKK